MPCCYHIRHEKYLADQSPSAVSYSAPDGTCPAVPSLRERAACVSLGGKKKTTNQAKSPGFHPELCFQYTLKGGSNWVDKSNVANFYVRSC